MTTLQMEKELLAGWYALPLEKQRAALEFVQFLNAQTPSAVPPLPKEEEHAEPHLVNEGGFWVIAGGSAMTSENAERDFVAEMREERLRSFFPDTP